VTQNKTSEIRRSVETDPCNLRVLPSPQTPLLVAREFERRNEGTDGRILHYWSGCWWAWLGSHYIRVGRVQMERLIYEWTEHATYQKGDEEVPWSPSRRKVGETLHALESVCSLSISEQSVWIDGRAADAVVPCHNGLLDVASKELLPHTPEYFNEFCVPFDYDPAASEPERWLRFLDSVWPDDLEQVALLQEWFGYVLSGRTDLEKALLVVGPTRSGKGTMFSTVLTGLIGKQNMTGPSFGTLCGEFGLEPCIGKALAIVPDARSQQKSGAGLTERILALTGDDTVTVNVKKEKMQDAKLGTRLVLISNELPRFVDSSTAVAGRFLILTLAQSFFGKEDLELKRDLRPELPGILNWSLVGLDRLIKQGRFTEPAAGQEALAELRSLASPVHAFLQERCELEPDAWIKKDSLYHAWVGWATSNGHDAGSKETFSKNIKAAAAITTSKAWGGGTREHRYVGVRLSVR
jgi:putative DNA primase/helicase